MILSMTKKTLITFLYFFLLTCLPVQGRVLSTGTSEGQKFHVYEHISGLKIPWGMTFVSDQLMLITEKSGNLKLLNLKNNQLESVSNPPRITQKGQGGLLDIRKDPTSDWIYTTYSLRTNRGIVTVLARGKLDGLRMKNWEKLLVTKVTSKTGRHFGSRIAFQGDYVFFTMGDRGERENGQNLLTHGATVMRLFKNGKIPKDNPFVGNDKALPEIWSYGHRNPQGLVFDKERNILWEMEHGPRGGDEINLVKKGANYGWPKASFGKEYWGPISVGEKVVKGTVPPVKFYVPSIAPCGLEVYSGKVFKKWKGNLFAGALKLRHLNRVTIHNLKATKEERLLKDLNKRIRNVIEGPNGLLYLSTDSGQILSLRPEK
jgi:aldose sugar dehydrogenase